MKSGDEAFDHQTGAQLHVWQVARLRCGCRYCLYSSATPRSFRALRASWTPGRAFWAVPAAAGGCSVSRFWRSRSSGDLPRFCSSNCGRRCHFVLGNFSRSACSRGALSCWCSSLLYRYPMRNIDVGACGRREKRRGYLWYAQLRASGSRVSLFRMVARTDSARSAWSVPGVRL